MASSSVNLKIFLRDGESTEARRLTVDANVATSFLYLKEKLQALFPTIPNLKVTWKDLDNDEITICSDEDLITAFTEMAGNVKVLYVTADYQTSGEGLDEDIPTGTFLVLTTVNKIHTKKLVK